jgi:hypothetical protein
MPVETPTTPPPLLRVLFLIAVWWTLLVGHFLVCGLLAYAIGHPDLMLGRLVSDDHDLVRRDYPGPQSPYLAHPAANRKKNPL